MIHIVLQYTNNITMTPLTEGSMESGNTLRQWYHNDFITVASQILEVTTDHIIIYIPHHLLILLFFYVG